VTLQGVSSAASFDSANFVDFQLLT
jgi:hypothetical protein